MTIQARQSLAEHNPTKVEPLLNEVKTIDGFTPSEAVNKNLFFAKTTTSDTKK